LSLNIKEFMGFLKFKEQLIKEYILLQILLIFMVLNIVISILLLKHLKRYNLWN
jgi:hypothetical protein